MEVVQICVSYDQFIKIDTWNLTLYGIYLEIRYELNRFLKDNPNSLAFWR